MSTIAKVQIIGAPIACQEGYQDAWRDAAEWAAGQLAARFGESVHVKYFDLFDADCPTFPPRLNCRLSWLTTSIYQLEGRYQFPLSARN